MNEWFRSLAHPPAPQQCDAARLVPKSHCTNPLHTRGDNDKETEWLTFLLFVKPWNKKDMRGLPEYLSYLFRNWPNSMMQWNDAVSLITKKGIYHCSRKHEMKMINMHAYARVTGIFIASVLKLIYHSITQPSDAVSLINQLQTTPK